MLNYNQALKETKTYSGLEMSETKPVMKLILRGIGFILKNTKSIFYKNWKMI